MEYIFSFFVSVLATSIGVAFALVGQHWYENRKNLKEAEYLKAKMKAELEVIKDTIADIHKGGSKLLLSPIKMPVYHGAVSSLKIVLLSIYDWYEELLRLYETLETYNAWHELKTKRALDNDKLLPEIGEMLLAIEKELLDHGDISDVSSQILLSEEDMIDGLFGGDVFADEEAPDSSLEDEIKGEIGNMISILDLNRKSTRIKGGKIR